MRIKTLLLASLVVSACATDPAAGLPADAVTTTRTEANGDVLTEYRVAGMLRMVKVTPSRGPTYYLQDRDGDGKLDWKSGEAPTTWFKLYGW